MFYSCRIWFICGQKFPYMGQEQCTSLLPVYILNFHIHNECMFMFSVTMVLVIHFIFRLSAVEYKMQLLILKLK